MNQLMKGFSYLGLLLCIVSSECFVLERGVQNLKPAVLPPPTGQSCPAKKRTNATVNVSRLEFWQQVAFGGSLAFLQPTSVAASGGATAGGAYLLSAKQRYNDRVLKGVAGFVALQPAVAKVDIDAVRVFFTTEEVGAWKDFSAAGYLLANAFRRSSSTPPDSLPSVKKWKAFAAEVETMTKSLKKNDAATALNAYESALVKLDEYLTQGVELSPLKEL